MEVISNEEFLEIVAEKEALWRTSHPHFSNKDIRAMHLEELSEASGMTVQFCKKKLKGFKDTFRANVAKLPKTKSGTPAFDKANNITWPFFENCLFMKDEIISRKNISASNEIDESGDDGTASKSVIPDRNAIESSITRTPGMRTSLSRVGTHTPSSLRGNNSIRTSKSRKRQNDGYDSEEELELLRKEVKSNGKVDSLRHFLLSLEDDLRSIPGYSLCAAKLELMQVVNKYVERQHVVVQDRDAGEGQSEACGSLEGYDQSTSTEQTIIQMQ